MKRLAHFLTINTLLLFSIYVQAQKPQVIPYQGTIANTSGDPYDGGFDFSFELQDLSGVTLWSSGSVNLDVNLGAYSVLLGQSPQPALPDSAWKDYDSVFLEITFDDAVNGAQTLLPRVQFYATPWSLRACYADNYCGDSLITKTIKVDSLFSKKVKIDTIISKKIKVDSLIAKKITVDTIKAGVACVDTIKAAKGVIDKVEAKEVNSDKYTGGIVDVDSVKAAVACVDSLKAKDVQADNVVAGDGTFLGDVFTLGNTSTDTLFANVVSAAIICADSIKAGNASFGTVEALSVEGVLGGFDILDVGELTVDSIEGTLKVDTLCVTDLIKIEDDFGILSVPIIDADIIFSGKAVIDTIQAKIICADSIKTPSLTIGNATYREDGVTYNDEPEPKIEAKDSGTGNESSATFDPLNQAIKFVSKFVSQSLDSLSKSAWELVDDATETFSRWFTKKEDTGEEVGFKADVENKKATAYSKSPSSDMEAGWSFGNDDAVLETEDLNTGNSTGIRFSPNSNQVRVEADQFAVENGGNMSRLMDFDDINRVGFHAVGDLNTGQSVEMAFLPNIQQIDVFGNMFIQGILGKLGGSFKIDHPQDPYNKYLVHSFVESPDMMNVYNGNITTDGSGEAIVELPDYFDALNEEFRYQLTVIGQFAQAIIAEEIVGTTFKIKTDKADVKVSWQVTGIRKDRFAEENRLQVEVEKEDHMKGKLLYSSQQ